eukprot:TRINITY_DN1043_c2_g1_i6.p1 TRINITY_DN1043_c2_g1~~TRINITY_DN1043_c2_g1_i6.p1  ORF type:complete len:244 (+),score=-14.49 TRINITY_DN1043_c2_g1_i6:1333-2064(+)
MLQNALFLLQKAVTNIISSTKCKNLTQSKKKKQSIITNQSTEDKITQTISPYNMLQFLQILKLKQIKIKTEHNITYHSRILHIQSQNMSYITYLHHQFCLGVKKSNYSLSYKDYMQYYLQQCPCVSRATKFTTNKDIGCEFQHNPQRCKKQYYSTVLKYYIFLKKNIFLYQKKYYQSQMNYRRAGNFSSMKFSLVCLIKSLARQNFFSKFLKCKRGFNNENTSFLAKNLYFCRPVKLHASKIS